jgi:hypothetical protein
MELSLHPVNSKGRPPLSACISSQAVIIGSLELKFQSKPRKSDKSTIPFKGGSSTLTLGMSRLSAVVHTFSAFDEIYRRDINPELCILLYVPLSCSRFLMLDYVNE